MAEIRTKCPGCAANLVASRTGDNVICPACGTRMTVPSSAAGTRGTGKSPGTGTATTGRQTASGATRKLEVRKVPDNSRMLATVMVSSIIILSLILLAKWGLKKKEIPPAVPVGDISGRADEMPAIGSIVIPAEEPKRKTKHAGIWERALKDAELDSGNNDKALEIFRKARQDLAGTEYETLAEEKIMELVSLQIKGNNQTEIVRKSDEPGLPKIMMEKILGSPDIQATDIAAGSGLDELLDSLATKLIAGRYGEAVSALDAAIADMAMPDSSQTLAALRKDIVGLANTSAAIRESFRRDIGKQICIETADGRRNAIVTDVGEDRISVESIDAGGRADVSVKTSLPLEKLAMNEKLMRMADLGAATVNMHAGLAELRLGNIGRSRELLARTGSLAPAFLKRLDRIQEKKRMLEARNLMLSLVRQAESRGESVSVDSIRSRIGDRNLPDGDAVLAAFLDYEAEKGMRNLLSEIGLKFLETGSDASKIRAGLARKGLSIDEQAKLRGAVEAYRKKFADTGYLKENDAFLATLLDEASRSFNRQFGKELVLVSVKMPLVPISPGEFRMGDTRRATRLTENFWIGKFEVTQAQYEKVAGANPSRHKNPDCPVENVTWKQADEFCRRLTEDERKKSSIPSGYVFRLPTEAEWEFCCRAGTDQLFSFGDSAGELGSYANVCDASCRENPKSRDDGIDDGSETTSAAGKYRPNPWGLFDMHGNVREWCFDWYGESLQPDAENPSGIPAGASKVNRGGAWDEPPAKCSSSHRGFDSPELAFDDLGFRVVLAPEIKP